MLTFFKYGNWLSRFQDIKLPPWSSGRKRVGYEFQIGNLISGIYTTRCLSGFVHDNLIVTYMYTLPSFAIKS